jgi:hypothetical protein
MLTVIGFPNTTTPGLLDALNDLGFAYRWVTRWIALDKTDATKHLTRLRRQWFAKRKSVGAILREVMFNRESALVDSDAENKALDADAALQELGADDVAFTTTCCAAPRADGRSSMPPCTARRSSRAGSRTASRPTRASSATPWPDRAGPPAPLEVAQAGNELTALSVKQSLALQSLLAAQHRADTKLLVFAQLPRMVAGPATAGPRNPA